MGSEDQSAGPLALHSQLTAAATAAATPQIAQVNVSQNSRMHIGPSFVNVTQNVHQDRIVKGRFLGLWLETRLRVAGDARRLRCSVAVFICWALVVVIALAVYVARLVLTTRPHRIDLEGGVCRVVWAWMRATSRGERLACSVVLVALVLCAVAAGIMTAPSNDPPPEPDPAPWYINRSMWLARNITGEVEEPDPWQKRFLPLRLVMVQHTAGPECSRFADCAAVMRNLLGYYVEKFNYDLPYNFVIGNDARVYEGRGWTRMGAHTRGYNYCAIGLAFTGNYADRKDGTVPKPEQLQRARDLLAEGVAEGWLHPKHVVLCARDVQISESPGDLMYAALRDFPGTPKHPEIYRNRTCDQIYEFEHIGDNKG